MDLNGAHIEGLPTEVLEMIFKNLKGTEVTKCRAVCRRWRDIIDAFTDNVWRHYASRDFRGNLRMAKNISNLSYKDLYISLSLWDKVEEATLTTIDMPSDPSFLVTYFKLLSNMRMCVTTQDLNNFDPSHMKLSNAIRYYDITSMQYISCEYFEYNFYYINENGRMIILLEDGRTRLHLIIKSNKKEKVCYLDETAYPGYNNFRTCANYVVFLNTNSVVCLAHIEAVNGEETIIIEELAELKCNFLAFALFNNKQIYVLSQVNQTNFNIFRYENGRFSLCDKIDNSTRSLNVKLKKYGFHWSTPSIYDHVYNPQDAFESKILAYNHVVIKGTSEMLINIYKRPYNENGDLNIFNQSSSRSIDCVFLGKITKLGVIEIKNGHRIVVLAQNKMCFYDLTHNLYNPLPSTQDASMTRKRRADSPSELSPSAKKSRMACTIS